MRSHFTPSSAGKKTIRSHFISGAAIACTVTGATALMPNTASAQAAYLRGDNKTARELAARAKTRFAVGTPGWVRADDIVTAKPLPGTKNN